MLNIPKNGKVFTQGDASGGLFFIQHGKVRLSVVSDEGKEAVLGILSEGDFFGEGSLAGQLVRMSSATAMTDCVVLHVENRAMMFAMSREPILAASFIEYLLKRNIRYQEDLVDQLFNSTEKRLARVLLLMANFGNEGGFEISVPRLRQETLAEMVGTTRARASFFMNRFRKLGFIDYDVGNTLCVRSSLLSVVLSDESRETTTGEGGKERHSADRPPTSPGRAPENERARRPPLTEP
jgi:CRP/FNR family transcriptional regulator, cyclic AMP receptor protein